MCIKANKPNLLKIMFYRRYLVLSISLCLLCLVQAGCDTQGMDPQSDSENEVVVETGEAALKMTKKAIRKAMQSPTAKMSVPPSEALKMLENDGTSARKSQNSGDVYGTTTVSRNELTIEENDYNINASTTSDTAGKVGVTTSLSVGDKLGASCPNCKSVAVATIRTVPNCTTLTAASFHQGPDGVTRSSGSAKCE